MKAELTDLHELLSREWEYHVPLFQRPYRWGTDLCENLVEDFLHLEKDSEAEHYLGALVIEHMSDSKYRIIDGQQQLTSLILLLQARGEKDLQLGAKLIPQGIEGETNDDRAKYASVRDGTPNGFEEDLYKSNFDFFQKAKELRVTRDVLERMKITRVILNSPGTDQDFRDEAQVVFAKMNVEGLNLEPFDLARNTIFMRARESAPGDQGVENQRRLYHSWKHFMAFFDGARERHRIYFLRDYLICKTRNFSITASRQIVGKFEAYLESHLGDTTIESLEKLVSDMWRYAEAWATAFYELPVPHDARLAEEIEFLRPCLGAVVLPLATELTLKALGRDSKVKPVDFSVLRKAILIDQFLDTSITKQQWFEVADAENFRAALIMQMKQTHGEEYLQVLEEALIGRTLETSETEALVSPEDNDIAEDERAKDLEESEDKTETSSWDESARNGAVPECQPEVYFAQNRLVQLLLAHEHALQKKWCDTPVRFVGNWHTLEHIVPQTPIPDNGWPENFQLSHTLGNLTLLGGAANSSVSNGSPSEKARKYANSSYAMTRRVGKELELRKHKELNDYVESRSKELAGEIKNALTLES